MKAKVMLVTPEVAVSMLTKNTHNRPLAPYVVEKYTEALRAGRWRENGVSIVFGTDGVLIDGQHRLAAIVAANVPVRMVVVECVDPESFATVDIGRGRAGSDVLSIMGEHSTAALSATLIAIDRYFTGRMLSMAGDYNPQIVTRLVSEYPDARKSVKTVLNTRPILGPSSILASCHYLFALVDTEAADLFIADLASGANLSETDGVFKLRERLLRNKLSKAKLPRHEIMALCIKAWNARRKGETVRLLVFRSGGQSAEQFPEVAS